MIPIYFVVSLSPAALLVPSVPPLVLPVLVDPDFSLPFADSAAALARFMVGKRKRGLRVNINS